MARQSRRTFLPPPLPDPCSESRSMTRSNFSFEAESGSRGVPPFSVCAPESARCKRWELISILMGPP